MEREIDKAKRAVRCSEHGPNLGRPVTIGQGGLRCADCGKFAEPCPTYCARHEVDWSHLSGYDHCPRCQEERRVEAERQEMLARRADPDMHPTIDAPRR